MSFELQLWHFSILGGILFAGCISTGFWALNNHRKMIHGVSAVLSFLSVLLMMITLGIHTVRWSDEVDNQVLLKSCQGEWRLLYNFCLTHDMSDDKLAIEDFAKKHEECPDDLLYLDGWTLFRNVLHRDNELLFQKHFSDCILVGWDNADLINGLGSGRL